MVGRVLITGGAGFIGSHVADELIENGYDVRLFDNLSPQVHGEDGGRPPYLHPDLELMAGDLRDPERVQDALRGVDAVIHLASMVGVGQSMYRIADYVAVNELGTAVLLEALAARPVGRLVMASSMSIYGEGLYRDADGALVTDATRRPEQLKGGAFEPVDSRDRPLEPLPTPESKPPALTSVYALNKYAQERLCLTIGETYDMPTTALRFFNVYGPRQALSNPYTGVLAIFAARLLNGRPPMVFEDGRQRRDFVAVRDVARACRLALERPQAAGRALNVGSGQSRTVEEVARTLARLLGREDLSPEITGRYRSGDIRHCYADLEQAQLHLGYRPLVAFESGLDELVVWLAEQRAVDRVERATEELTARGLVG